ncbi:hypothetical protein HXX76_008856 [Chlamydomonas incerta]|uniref:Peptidase M11 gametolysin domain-containing protein n=1 Tax=Chlamydomonas incerta TaxID=51695 RepID=A0A835SVC9_CHLIN|nr:hypothetical protein HXX76_008856 [Chlamydomonas incerta]|eukprot:KAG2432511.1 hypothetical protein HXX76_008856 [Chlamydomonas incerta]
MERVVPERELVYIDYHDGTGDYAVTDTNNGKGKFESLGKGKKPPKKDKDNKDIKIGDYVTIGCTVDATTGQCSAISSTDVSVVKASYIPPAVNVYPKVLILLVDAPACGSGLPSSASVSSISQLYFGPNLDGKAGWAFRAENCSYGEVQIDVPNSKVMTVTPACTWPTTSCDAWAMANAANAAANTALGATVYNTFTHFHTLMAVPSACSWAGLATLGGGQSGGQVWLNLNTFTQTFSSWGQVPLQEMIHNFVLYHGYSSGIEYQDKTSFMGTGTACPSTPEMNWLGWASPVQGGEGLDSVALAPGAALGPYTIPATWATGLGNFVRVKTDWASWYTNANYGMNLYFELRQAVNGDANLDPLYAGKVVVHEILSYMDNDIPTYRSSDPRSNYMTSVLPNTRTVLSSPSLGVAYNLVLYAGALSGSRSEFVPLYLCRFVTADTEGSKPKPGERAPPMPPMPAELETSPPPRRALAQAPGQDKKALEGELVYIDYHDGTGDYAVTDTNNGKGKFESLGKGKKPPKKDKDNKDIKIGDYVTIGCTVDATTGQCSAISSTDVAVVKASYIPPATNVFPKVLILLVNAPACGSGLPSSASVSSISQLYFGPNLDGKAGWAFRAENCSYGEVQIDVPNSKVMTVTPACTWPTTSCDAWAIANAANAAAKASLGDAAFNAYTHFHTLMAMPSACSWAGLATLGGGQSGGQVWLNLNTFTQTFSSWGQVPLQEMIHNFVIYHGYSSGIEYQDKTSFMGTGTACPSTPEMNWLGWASPVQGGEGLDSVALAPGAALGPYTIPATWATGLGNFVRVKTDWASWYTNANYGMNLYFELRQAVNGDANLDPLYAGKVVVHEILSYMDNDIPTYRSSDPPLQLHDLVASASSLAAGPSSVPVAAAVASPSPSSPCPSPKPAPVPFAAAPASPSSSPSSLTVASPQGF